MNVPEDYRYTEEHEWIRREGDQAVIGITAYASNELGGVTFIELPSEGDELTQAEPFAEVESVKAVSDVYAPASGTVVEVHEGLAEHPELIDGGPYEDGWICRIELENPDELDALMEAGEYREYVEGLEE
jgi:glycine cleavage system H protein